MSEKVTLTRAREIIPTYVPKPPVELPMFFEKKPYQGATGRLYPLNLTTFNVNMTALTGDKDPLYGNGEKTKTIEGEEPAFSSYSHKHNIRNLFSYILLYCYYLFYYFS